MIDIGWEISQQDLFSGSVQGLIVAALAAGFVLIYRSTGVLNFAHAEIGSFGVALMAMLTFRYDVPYWLAFFLSVGAAAGFAMVTELVVVRRLFDSPRLVLFIATLGVAQLAIFAAIELPDVSRPGTVPVAPEAHRPGVPVGGDRPSPHRWAGAHRGDHGAAGNRGLGAIPGPHPVWVGHSSRSGERRHRKAVRHQRSPGVHHGVDHRRGAGWGSRSFCWRRSGSAPPTQAPPVSAPDCFCGCCWWR